MIGDGISLGLLLGSKFSAVGIVAGLGAAGAIFVLRGGRLAMPGKSEARGFGPALELALRIAVIAIVTVAATYAFVHFPEWAKGLRFQLTRGAHGDGVMYLNGDVARRGWFHYFLVALALKLPLGLLFTAGAAAAWRLTRARPALRSAFLCRAAADLLRLGLVLARRYRRPRDPAGASLPLRARGRAGRTGVLSSRAIVSIDVGPGVVCLRRGTVQPTRDRLLQRDCGRSGRRSQYLADSNLDWGQGLPQLKEWMNREGVEVVYLAYFGTDHPEAHGLRFQALPGYGRAGSPGGELIPADAPRHVVVVSANLLLGMFLNEPDAYSWLRDRAPTNNESVLAKIIGGWQLSGIVRYTSGATLGVSATQANPVYRGGATAEGIGGSTAIPQTADVVSGVPMVLDTKDFDPRADRYLNAAAFAQPTGAFGASMLTIDGLRGFASLNEDLALAKTIRMQGNSTLQIRVEMFNAFNRVEFGNPASNIGNPETFGRITSQANTPRNMQIALKVTF